METIGYIYAVILYVFNKKISVEDTLKIIRAKILEQDKETMQEQITPHERKRRLSPKALPKNL